MPVNRVYASRLMILTVGLACVATAARAQNYRTWVGPAGGIWLHDPNWAPAFAPNQTTHSPVFPSNGSYPARTAGAQLVADTMILHAGSILDIDAGTQIKVYGGPLQNDGIIRINPTNGPLAASILFQDLTGFPPTPDIIQGTGEVWLMGDGARSELRELNENRAPHTIRGIGTVSLTNYGSIIADAIGPAGSGTELWYPGGDNRGTMRAAPGARLAIGRTGTLPLTFNNHPGAVLDAGDGTIEFRGTEYAGVPPVITGQGEIVVTGEFRYHPSASHLPFRLDLGVFRALMPTTFTNNGVITDDGGAGGAFQAEGALGGTGLIHLGQGTTRKGDVGFHTHLAPHVIRGTGEVGGTVNESTIIADDSAAGASSPIMELRLETNRGLISVENGTILRYLSEDLIQEGDGRVEVVDGVLELREVDISGGLITAHPGSLVAIDDVVGRRVVMDNVTLAGDFRVRDVHVLNIEGQSTLTNNGTITLEQVAPGATRAGTLEAGFTSVLAGTGHLRMAGPTGLSRILGWSTPTGTMIHEADHTISGVGLISAPMLNRGTIRADASGATPPTTDLRLNDENKTNEGLMEVRPGARLVIDCIVTQSPAGRIRADDGDAVLESSLSGGRVQLDGGARLLLNGGGVSSALVEATAAGRVEVAPAGGWAGNGVVLNAPVLVTPGATFSVDGSPATINSVVTVAPGTGSTPTRVRVAGRMAGSGEIGLAGGPTATELSVATFSGPPTLGPLLTIRGDGRIAGPFLIEGRLSPGDSAQGIGAFTMAGTNTLKPPAVVEIGVASLAAGGADMLTGIGTLALDGTLRVVASPGLPAQPLDRALIIEVGMLTGRFTHIERVGLPQGLSVTPVYSPTSVELWFHCPPDITTTAVAGSAGHGIPNGVVNNDDFFFYLGQFAAGNAAVADMTATALPGSPGYGIPNGIVNNDDFFYYLAAFAGPC